ncbi:DUF6308 family protein (plasmid) [Arthrobacter sp. KN11-1C]|uniref:DUF6308 family protein n=1 Tax=Arthrobacter sp. KN11-1C TaxID=3445774 RepID=UPI003F9ED51A
MDVRIASAFLSLDDVLDLIYGYDIRKIDVYDLGMVSEDSYNRAALDPYRFSLEDCARVIALGVTMTPQELFDTIAVGRSEVLSRIPTTSNLRDFSTREQPELWTTVVRVYELMRYQYGMGATLATALLHLKRPSLIPVLLEPCVSLYTESAVLIASEMKFGVPLYWEAIRQDLIHNEPTLRLLRSALAERVDSRSARLLTLSDLRISCILAEQYASALRS